MNQQQTKDTTGLVGTNNEVTVKVNNILPLVLLDTGSTVSTVVEFFYRQYISDEAIHQLDKILNIECADGQQLPYLGYIKVYLELPGSSTADEPIQCMMNQYSASY